MVVVVAVSVVAPLLLLVVVLIKCLGCLRKKEGFKTFENEDARMEARINPGFAMGQDVDDRDQTMSTTIQIEPLPELLAESTPRKPKIACVEKTKQEAAFKLVVINNPHPFPRRQLTYLKEIGNGWFGQVLESDAEHITTGIPLSRVVAKVLRDDASNSEKKLFLEDVVPYRELEHSNVLRLLGQCTESAPYLMILEYAQMGDLKTCAKKLKDRADVMTQNYQVVKFAIDAASGLACLHRHGYIHQDFAARNCVVMADYTVKIGDYGISEDVFKDDYYVSGKESLPIRWMAPETLSQQSGSWQTAVITREANIWSFGVLLWEVLMFGKQPYGNMADDQVLQTVIADRMVKLPEPDVDIQFKDRIVEVMLFCWLNPGERPSIEDAHGLLQRLYEIVAGDQVKAENFEKKWNQMIPHEARIVSARPQPRQQKRPTSASFDNNFVQEPKPEPQQALTEQSTKPGDLVSVKIEDMSTSVVNGDHIAVNMQPSLAGNLAQLPTPSRHTLPAHMTSTPIMDLAPTPTEPDVSQKQQKSGSGSRTSRKIEDEFSIAQVASTKSNSGSMASPVPSEEKTPDVLIDVPQDDTAADLLALGKEENVPVSDQFDLLGGKTAISATQQASSVDVLEAVSEPVQDVQNRPNTQEENKQEQASVANKDPFADLFGQGDFADQIKPVSSQPNSSSELLPTNGNQSLLSESSPKCDAESPVSGVDEPDTKAEPVGKQTASSDTRPDTDVEPQNFLSNDIDLVSSHNFQAESIIPSTFHPSERSAGEPVSKGENVKPSDLALDNGTSGYETPADQSVKSDSIEENTSGAESSSDSAVCVSSPELADAPSSFDGAAPSHEKVGTCVEYVSDDESKSSSSESDSSSDSSNSGSSYVCEESRRIIQVTDLDADDDDSDNLDEHQDNISDEVTDSDEDLDLRLASELYLSKGVSSPRVFERPPLETIPEDVMPSPSDTSSIDLKFDAHFDDVFASQDNFEWDDFMGESIVGRDRTSNTPKASFDMSDWLMDGESLSYRSSGSIQSPLESVSPDVLGTSDPSIRLSTASTSEVKRQRGRTSRSYVSDLITNRSIHDSFTNTKNTRTPFYSLFDNVDMDSDSDTNLSPESNQPESRLIETAPTGLHDKVEDLESGSRTDDSLFIQQPSLGPTDATFSVETSVSSAPMLEADVTNQKLPSEQQTEESPDPADSFKGLGLIDKGKGNEIEQGQPKKKPVPEDLESAFEELATQHGIDLFGSGEVSNTSDSQYNEFSFESLGKSDDVNLFDDFLSPDINDKSDKSEVPSVAAFFTGSDIPEIPVASKAVDATPVKPLEDDSFSREIGISQTASSIDFVTSEVDSSSVIPTEKSESDPHEKGKNEFIDVNIAPNNNDQSDGEPAQSYALTQSGIEDKSGSDESDKTQQFTHPETVSFSDLDATEVHSFPEGQSVNAPNIPSVSELELPPAAASTIDMAGIPEVSNSFSQENIKDSLTQLGDSLVNIDVLGIHTEASDMLQGSYEAPPDCQVVEVSTTSGSSVIQECGVSLEDAEITSPPVCGSESEIHKIPSSDKLQENSQISPDVEKHPADKPDGTALEPTALFNQNRRDDSVFANVETESEVSVKQEDSDINFEKNFSFTIEPHYSPQGKENYESEDNTSFDMVWTSSDVEIITESPTCSMDNLNKSEIAVVCEPVEIVPSDSPPNVSPSVEIEPPSKDAVQDSMPYAGPTATPHVLPADTDSNGDEVATGDVGAHDDAGIAGENLVVMDTDKDDDTFPALEQHSFGSQMDDDIQQTVNQTDVFEVMATNQSAVVEESSDPDVSENLIPNKKSDNLDDFFSSGSLVAQENDLSLKPSDFQADVVDDSLLPVQLIDKEEIPTTSFSNILTEDAVNETDTEKEIYTFETSPPIQGISQEQHQLPSSENSDFNGFEQIPVPNDLSLVPNSHQLIDEDQIVVETQQPQDQFIGVNMSQQIPSNEDDGFTDLEGFNRIPVPDDLPSISDSEQFTSFTDPKSQSDISIETKENTTEVTGSSGIASNVINDFGQQFIPGMDTLEERTTEQYDAPDFTSHMSEHDAPEENAEKEDQTDAELTGLIMSDSLKTDDGVVESESVNFAENVINVNAPGSSCYLDADADQQDVDVPSQPVKPSDGAPTETESESPELMSSQFEVDINLDTGHPDQVSTSEQGSWASDASEAGSNQSINDFEDLGMTTPEQVELSQTGDGSTVSTDSLLDGFVEILSSPVGVDISETREAEANSDSKFPENTEAGQDGETVDGTGDGFLVLSVSEEDKQAKLYNDGSNESNVGQGIIDFPDSSLTDSQESAAFLDLSSSQEGLVEDNDEFGMSETSVLNGASTVREINIGTGREQAADSGVLSMSPPIASSQTEGIILKPFEDLSSDLNMHPRQNTMSDPAVSKAAQVIPPEDSVSLSPTDDKVATNLPFNNLTPINNEIIGTNGLKSTTDPEADPSVVPTQNQMKGLTSSNESSVLNIDDSDAVLPVMTRQTEDSDPFGLTSSESSVSNPVASDAFPSVEPGPTTDSDPFGLPSSESTVPNLEALDAFPSVETEQTVDSDPFGLATPSGENILTDLGASDPFPSVEPGPTSDSDPFGLPSSESTVPNLEASDAFPSIETEQTVDSDPFGLATPSGENILTDLGASDPLPSVEPGPSTNSDPFDLTSATVENIVPNLDASDVLPSVETEQTADSDPFGLATPSGENILTDLGASDPFPSVEPGPTSDSDPFGLPSSESTVPNLEASDAFPSIETEQTVDSDPFGLATPSGENILTDLGASDPFPSVEPGPTSDSDPFGLPSSESTVPNLEALDAFPSIETEQTVDSDPFGLAAPSGENILTDLGASDPFPSVEPGPSTNSDPFDLTSATVENIVPNLDASDALPSVETEQTADSDPFGLATPSGENILTDLGASDPFPSVEPGPTSDSDPFGLPSSESTVPNLDASDALPSVETEQTVDSDPFGLATPSGENILTDLGASDPFPSVEPGPTSDSDPFGLPSSESTVPNLEASDAFPSIETEQTVDSDLFGLAAPSGENILTDLGASDPFPSVEPGPTSDSDPFGLPSSESTVPNLEALDAFPSIETEQTVDSDPFGLAAPSGENILTDLGASDPFPSVEPGPSTNSDPFDLTSATVENIVPNLDASDALPSVETEQTADSDPFGLATPSGENILTDLGASDPFPSVEPGPTSDSDPFGLPSSESTVPNLEASDAFPSIETEQTVDSDPFGLATPSGENILTDLGASDPFPSVEPGPTSDSDPFGLPSSESTVPNLEASDAFPSIETEQTVDSDLFGLAAPSGENILTDLGASDPFPSVEPGPTSDSDPFGLPSSESTVPNLEALDAFPSIETEQTVDSDPFGLAAPSGENILTDLGASDPFPSVEPGPSTNSDPFDLTSATVENIVPNLDASDALPSVESEQTADSDPFGLATPSGENILTDLGASDPFPSVEPGPTSDSDPFGLPSSESTVPNLEASDAFPSIETEQTVDSDPFGLATPSGENILTDLGASDPFPSVEPGPTSDSDPFGLPSSESTVPNLEASDAFPSIETEQTVDSDLFGLAAPSGENILTDLGASDPFPSVEPGPTSDSDPFGLPSSESTVPNLEALDAFPSIETEQTVDSDPFGLAAPSGENILTDLGASDPFPSVEPGPSTNSDPFDLTSATVENIVPNLDASDALPSVESEQTADSDPFGLATPSGENILTDLGASDPFPSVEPGPTSDSDPFGLPSSESTVPNLEASDAFPSIETEQTVDSDLFGLAAPSGENILTDLGASDPFPSVEPGPTSDSDPFGLPSSESTVPNLEASDAFPSIETEQTVDSDPFGLATPSGENILTDLGASDQFPSVEPGPSTNSDPFDLTSATVENIVPNLDASDALLSVEPGPTTDSDPFHLTSSENTLTNLVASEGFPSEESGTTTDSDPFGLTFSENTVPKLEAVDAFPSVETEQTIDSDPFSLASTSGENTETDLGASDPFPSVESGPTTDSDPFGLTSATVENIVPNPTASDTLPSVETEQTADSDPFSLAKTPGENTLTNLVASDAFPSVESGPTTDSDQFGLTSSENSIPKLEAVDVFPSIETEQTADSDPFGLAIPSGENTLTDLGASDPFPSVESGPTIDSDPFGLPSATVENIVPNLNASDSLPAIETEQTVDSDPFGLAIPSGENTLTDLVASDAFPSVGPGPTTDSDPFGLTSSENTVPKLEAVDAFPSIETEQTADSDPFGLAIPSGENTLTDLSASDASVEPGPTTDSNPFGLTSSENTLTNLVASEGFPSEESGTTTDSDPFGLTFSENTVPKLEVVDAFTSVETEQTVDSDPFSLASIAGENTETDLGASDPFPSVESGPTTDSDPFGLTSATVENIVPNPTASDALPSVETEQTADSDPFSLATTPGENTLTNLVASDAFPSVESGPTTDSDPFGLTSSENSVPKLEAVDVFPSIETEQTADSDPFGLAIPSGENTLTDLGASDPFPSVESGPTTDSDPFGLPSATVENIVPNLNASDSLPTIETEQTADSDPFGLAIPSGENTLTDLVASDAFPSVEPGPTTDSDPFGLTSSENSVPKLEAVDVFPSIETEQTADSDPFGLTSSMNSVPNFWAHDTFHPIETGQTADNDPFGLATPSGEKTLTNMGASDSHSSVEPGKEVDSYPFGSASSQEDTVHSTSEQIFSAETNQVADSDTFGLTNPSQNDTVPNHSASIAFTPLETAQTADSDPFGLISQTEPSKLQTGDMFDVSPGSNVETGTTLQNPMTDSGMLLDFVQSGSEAPSQTNSGTSAEMFGSSLDFTSPSSTQDSSQSAADTKESDQSVLLDMFEKPPDTQNIEPQSSTTSSLVDLF